MNLDLTRINGRNYNMRRAEVGNRAQNPPYTGRQISSVYTRKRSKIMIISEDLVVDEYQHWDKYEFRKWCWPWKLYEYEVI